MVRVVENVDLVTVRGGGLLPEHVAADPEWEGLYMDLTVIASVLRSPDEQLRWFLEASQLDDGRDLYLLRDAPWHDPIRSSAEFQAWLEREAEEVPAQRRRRVTSEP